MAVVGVDSGSLYRQTCSLSCLAWSCVGGRLAPFYIHQMNRVNSQWFCYDYSTINIVLDLLLLLLLLFAVWTHCFMLPACRTFMNIDDLSRKSQLSEMWNEQDTNLNNS